MSEEDKPKPHWLGHRDRLRQKLLTRGADALDDYELLETLLFAFLPRRDVKPIAKALLARFGGLSAIFAAPPEDIANVKGMGETSAAYLKATAALSARAAREEIAAKPVISSWTALVTYVRTQLQHETREQFRVLFLDSKNQLIADEAMATARSMKLPSTRARLPAAHWSWLPLHSSLYTITPPATPHPRAPTSTLQES